MTTSDSPAIVACPACGAHQTGPLCEYCGALVRADLSVDEEHEALVRFQYLLSEAPPDRQVRLLRHGFVPTSPQLVIEAGVQCLAALEHDTGEVGTAAASRLSAIIARLRIGQSGSEAERAIVQFTEALARHARRSDSDARLGCVFILAILAVAASLVAYLVLR